MLRRFSFLAVVICLASGCDKEGVGNFPLKDAKPGWSVSAIKNYIACEPAQSKKCQCVVKEITSKYTPDQVKEKSPLVAADILSAQVRCEGSLLKNPVTIEAPKPSPGTGTSCPPGSGPCNQL